MKHNIDDLLDKYWNGESSIQDEQQLNAYFRSNNVDEAHISFAPLFEYISEASKVKSPDFDDVNLLLEKYWEGDTTVQEENHLKAYFNSGQVIDKHQAFMPLFAYFDDQSKIKFPELASHANVEKSTVQVRQLHIKKWVYASAASLALVFGSIFVVKNLQPEEPVQKYAHIQEIEDPKEALRVTKEALALVSKKFRKSQETIKENLGALDKATVFK